MLSRCFLDFSVGVGDLVIGLSQTSSIFSCCPDSDSRRIFEQAVEVMNNLTGVRWLRKSSDVEDMTGMRDYVLVKADTRYLMLQVKRQNT